MFYRNMSVQKFGAFLTGKNMTNINNEDISNLSKVIKKGTKTVSSYCIPI